jgi:hypothetical protein
VRIRKIGQGLARDSRQHRLPFFIVSGPSGGALALLPLFSAAFGAVFSLAALSRFGADLPRVSPSQGREVSRLAAEELKADLKEIEGGWGVVYY